MPTIVEFLGNNAYVHVNPENLQELKAMPNTVMDPDLAPVRGLPPHFWKQVGNSIEAMTKEEQDLVLTDHATNGINNKATALQPKAPLLAPTPEPVLPTPEPTPEPAPATMPAPEATTTLWWIYPLLAAAVAALAYWRFGA